MICQTLSSTGVQSNEVETVCLRCMFIHRVFFTISFRMCLSVRYVCLGKTCVEYIIASAIRVTIIKYFMKFFSVRIWND